MKTLYIGCSLITAPADFLRFMEEVKVAVARDFDVIHFVGLDREATPAHVYETDIACAKRAEVMLAIADYPSTGLGMEIQARIELSLPTLVVHRAGITVSKMPRGAAEIYPFMSTISYESVDDIVEALQQYV